MKLLSLVLLLPLVACSLDDYATPEERRQLDAREAEVDAAEDVAQAALQRAVVATDALVQALASGEPQAIAQAAQEASEALDAAEAAGSSLDDVMASYEAAFGSIKDRVVHQAGTVLLPWLPAPLNGPLGVVALQVAALLGFDRSRKHLGSALKGLSRGKVVEALRAVLKAAGMLHTSQATAEVAKAEQAS